MYTRLHKIANDPTVPLDNYCKQQMIRSIILIW